ncbi:hypothetical protein BLGI_2634 [Brevibacillus laterosporus GI-9]|nr:hypothetical protein BLGI_2634 [Brevibacillus laterosporus GI-9]
MSTIFCYISPFFPLLHNLTGITKAASLKRRPLVGLFLHA